MFKAKRSPVLAGEAVAMGPLALTTSLLLFSNQTIRVWLFVFVGVPTLFVGLLIATTPTYASSLGKPKGR